MENRPYDKKLEELKQIATVSITRGTGMLSQNRFVSRRLKLCASSLTKEISAVISSRYPPSNKLFV